MPSPTQKIGSLAEKFARHYLESRGLTFVEENFHCRLGEIDLIMREQELLVFIEVRLRDNDDYGGSLYSVTLSKQKKLIRTATFYLQKHRLYNSQSCRFDVVALEREGSQKLKWIKDAFQAQ